MWLKDMRCLTHLDIGGNTNMSLINLIHFTQLEVLSLQNLDLSQPPLVRDTLRDYNIVLTTLSR